MLQRSSAISALVLMGACLSACSGGAGTTTPGMPAPTSVNPTNKSYPGAGQPGPYVYVVSANGVIDTHLDVFSEATGDLVTQIVFPCEASVAIEQLDFNSGRTKLYAMLNNGDIDVVETKGNVVRTLVKGNSTTPVGGSIALSRNNASVYQLAIANNGSIALNEYDASTGALEATNAKPAQDEPPLFVGADGTVYALYDRGAGSPSATINLDEYSGTTLAKTASIAIPNDQAALGAINSQGTMLFSFGMDAGKPIDELSIPSGTVVRQFTAVPAADGPVTGLALSSDAATLYAMANSALDVLDTGSGALVASLTPAGGGGVSINGAGSRVFWTRNDTHVYEASTSGYATLPPLDAPYRQETYTAIAAQ